MENKNIAGIFRRIAEILEFKGENSFRIRAYLKAARNIESLNEDVRRLVEKKLLDGIPGIGKDLAEKITEIVNTGRLKFYEQLRKDIPEGLDLLMSVPGVGPKTVKFLYENLGIKNIDDLEKAALAHKISVLPGFKEKTEENILRGIALVKALGEKILLSEGLEIADEFIKALKALKEVKQAEAAGSLRRRKETVKDIDILVLSEYPQRVMDAFTSFSLVKEVLARGVTKSSVLTLSGIQVDLRVVPEKSFGAAMLYFTGSKEHNIRLRRMAVEKGLKINEYGLFKNDKFLAGKTEAEVFKKVGLPYIIPELREDKGEIEAALAGGLPDVVALKDIRGDLHVHSDWSDGSASIEEMAKAARGKGYGYIAITDHSRSLRVAGGLTAGMLKRQRELIYKLNKKFKDFRILAGSEVDIKADGSLDYPDSILKELDIVIAAVHSGFRQSQEKLSSRIARAMENRYVNIIAHPSGRLLRQRDAYSLDIEFLLQKAKQTGTFIEVNAFPVRLDLTDSGCRRAKELGQGVSISTDAHRVEHLVYIDFGVNVARRGWLEKKDVINTLCEDRLMKLLNKKRQGI